MAHNSGASTAHSPPPYHQPPAPYGGPSSHTTISPYNSQKQQRLSPNNVMSPYGSPQYTNGTIPNANFYAAPTNSTQNSPAFGGPYVNGAHGGSTAGQSLHNSSNMAPPSTPGAMGPPSKPVEDKPVDVNDLGDVLAGSGVDIREEEANLVGMMRKQGQPNNTYGSAATAPAITESSTSYFEHPAHGYSVYSQNQPGPRSSFYGGGTFNQPAITEEQLQEQTKQKQKLLVRKRAEIMSHPNNDPFLQTHKLVWRIKKKADAKGVQIQDVQSTSDRSFTPRASVLPNQHGDSLVMVNGRSQSIGPPLDIMSLLSLGCKDRLRNVLENAVWMARSRIDTSHGEVPPELKDLASGQGQAEEIEIDLSSSAQSKKRSSAEANLGSGATDQAGPKKIKTIAFPNSDMALLNSIMDHEREFEKRRVEKRATRNMSQLTGDGTSSGTATPGGLGTPGSGSGNPLAEIKKMTKKELKKATENKQSEADIAKASNSAASMALGGSAGPSWLKGMGGGTKKKVDWLKSKQPGSTSFSAPVSRTTSSNQIPKTTTTTIPVSENRPLKYGEQREDAAGYRDIQVRDLLKAMEVDKKEILALTRGYNKLG